jgi:hypothetical protein
MEDLLAADPPEIRQLLTELGPAEAEFEPGQEHQRILNDLAGRELAMMQRELFGDGSMPGKIHYRHAGGGRRITLRFEVTKRQIHAPVGFAEGVCTATDQQLWDQPQFLQVVIWDPDGRAAGGVHLLILKEDGELYLTLPGINPSLALLRETGAGEALDAVVRFALRLARAWHLRGVWIPADLSMASNRGPVAGAISRRGYPVRRIQRKPFSYSPYSYSIDRVLVVADALDGTEAS